MSNIEGLSVAESARRRIQLLQQELVQEERFIESVAAAIAHTSHAKQYTSVQQAKKKLDGVILTPVSYTHLRAHETVLDIVCRLLLEKNTT